MRARRNSCTRWTRLGPIVPMMMMVSLGIGCNDRGDTAVTAGQAERAEPEPVVGKTAEEEQPRGAMQPGGEPGSPTGQPAADGQQQAANGQQQAAAACPPVEDRGLVTALERELQEDPAVPEGIEVAVQYGVVTLTGTVDDLIAEQRALRTAETMRGVRVVIDDLEVKPAKAVDDQALRQDVMQALRDDPTADAWQMDVAVSDGRVTLSGTLQSWTEKAHAERVVQGVRGVSAVENQITVQRPKERPDAEIQQDVQARLRWDALVPDPLVNVRVEDGEVRLMGTVRSAAQRRRARNDAWVAGATHVDVTDLQVEPCAVATTRDPAQARPDDAAIVAAIEVAMALDPMVYSFDVDPQAQGGTVTLTGTVDNARARAAAEQIARNTVGVTEVVNRIDVKTEQPVDDQALASRVDQALLRNAITESFEIDVTAADGQVTLTGTVDDYSEYAEATDVASGITGVVSVDNQLSVAEPTPFVYDPYLLPYHPYAGPGWWYGTVTTTESDAEIAEEIRDELFWSPFVDRDEVSVTVQSGKATLTGTVDSWEEKRAATENAWEGGAVSVDNQLTVRGYG